MKGWFSAVKQGTDKTNYEEFSGDPDEMLDDMLNLMEIRLDERIFRMMSDARWSDSNGMGMQPLSFPTLESFGRIFTEYDVQPDDMKFMAEMSEEYVKWHQKGKEKSVHPGRHEEYEDLIAIQEHFERMKYDA